MSERRKFKLAVTILDGVEFEGAHAVLALVQVAGDPEPTLQVQAGGFTTNNEGAAELAEMLWDAAHALAEELGHTLPDVERAEAQPKRPRFNPQPRGAGRG